MQCSAKRHVRFTPNSDHESGFPQQAMSALPPKADLCGATRDDRFGPIADMSCRADRPRLDDDVSNVVFRGKCSIGSAAYEVNIPDTVCRHRPEPSNPAGRYRIVPLGTIFLVAHSCSVRLSRHHIHSLAHRSIRRRSSDNRDREHHNSHRHSIALRQRSRSLKEMSRQIGSKQVSSSSPPIGGT